MTVFELMEELVRYSPDTKVILGSSDNTFGEAVEVVVYTVGEIEIECK